MTIPNKDIDTLPRKIDTPESDHKRADYFSEIVAAATFAPPGIEVQTFLKCRRRPERKPCSGQILVRLEEKPAQLHWWCSECENKGIIRNWKGTPGLVVHRKTQTIPGVTECEIILSQEEYSLLNSIKIIEPFAEKAVRGAEKSNDGAKILGTISTFDTIMGYIAFEANHSEKEIKQQSLHVLLNKLKAFIDNTMR